MESRSLSLSLSGTCPNDILHNVREVKTKKQRKEILPVAFSSAWLYADALVNASSEWWLREEKGGEKWENRLNKDVYNVIDIV